MNEPSDNDPHADGPVAAFFDRMFSWAFAMMMALDQLVACWVRGWVFVWLKGAEPDPDETLSSWIGRSSLAGYRAARVAEAVIDFFMGAGHCRDAIGK